MSERTPLADVCWPRVVGSMMDGLRLPRADSSAADPPISAKRPDLLYSARRVAAVASELAESLDCDGAFPVDDIGHLNACGLLVAPFPWAKKGQGIAVETPDVLQPILTAIGRGSLSLGRLYEGHVNAVGLTIRYGNDANLDLLKKTLTRAFRLACGWPASRCVLNGASTAACACAAVKSYAPVQGSSDGRLSRPIMMVIRSCSSRVFPTTDVAPTLRTGERRECALQRPALSTSME